MKKVLHIISLVLQYAVTAFLAFMTLGGFITAFPAGIVFLLSTLLACPFTRNKGYDFIQKIFKIPMKQIKGWIIIPIFILFCVGVSLIPASESNTDNQIVEAEICATSETLIAEAEESIAASIEASIAANLEQIEVVEESKESVAVAPSEESTTPIETPQPTVEPSQPAEIKVEEPTVSEMEVHFIDVGQGDAILVKADGHYMLIDAGDNDKGTTVQLYLQKQGVEKLDYLVLTHTDSDHIGGADVIITKFDVDTVFLGDFKKDNKTYEELMNALEYKVLKYSTPEVGSEYELGNATFTIVAPNNTYEDPNNSSIALVLANGDDTFLFTGDCEEEAESDILSNGLNIDCDVYKVGHHGSKMASSQDFLNAVTPIYGVISCAEGNSYGHPHAEPLNNLRSMGVQVFRTDEQGSVIAYSNGTDITWNCAPSDTWQVGEVAPTPTPEPTATPSPTVEPTSEVQESTETGAYAVNGNNGKIHIVGACSATGDGENAMKHPVYFDTYEEAENHSIAIAPGQDKRQCGNCW